MAVLFYGAGIRECASSMDMVSDLKIGLC